MKGTEISYTRKQSLFVSLTVHLFSLLYQSRTLGNCRVVPRALLY
jgi:hypothetical protein